MPSSVAYQNNPEPAKMRSSLAYQKNPQAAKIQSTLAYRLNPEPAKMRSVHAYKCNPEKAKQYTRDRCKYQPHKRRLQNRQYYLRSREFTLKKPDFAHRQRYSERLNASIFNDRAVKVQVLKSFQKGRNCVGNSKLMMSTAVTVAVKRFMNRILHLRSSVAGDLLKVAQTVVNFKIDSREGFGKCMHSTHSEPYFYDAAYHCECIREVKYGSRDCRECMDPSSMDPSTQTCVLQCKHLPVVVPVDSTGKCYTTVFTPIVSRDRKNVEGVQHCVPMQWGCTPECKAIEQWEVDAILELIKSFELPVKELRQILDTCDDGCPNSHYIGTYEGTITDDRLSYPDRGHPLLCYNNSGCTSKLRILRAASVHFPLLRRVVICVYAAVSAHNKLIQIDKALNQGDCVAIMSLLRISCFDDLLSNEIDLTFSNLTSPDESDIIDEADLRIRHAEIIAEYEKEINDFPSYVCCCCE